MKNGFTLIETVIVIGISVVALIALANLFIVFNSLYGNQQAFMAASGSASSAMNALEAAVMPADAVLSSHTFSGTVYSSGAATLVLELPSVDSAGNIITSTNDYIVFYTSGTKLYRLTQPSGGSARTAGVTQLSTTLDTLSFTYDNADFTRVTSITADIRTQAQFKQQIIQAHLTEDIYLRNAPLSLP